MKKTLGIVGFGQFGRLISSIVPHDIEVLFFDKIPIRREFLSRDCRVGSFADVCGCDIVVFAVPVQEMEVTLKRSATFLKHGAWVLDVASVKTFPAQWMLQHLPEDVDLTATHPLFGPQSAELGLKDQRLVLCPLRGRKHLMLARLARRLGLKVHITDPKTHDREMAHVQALTHLIGRAVIGTGRPNLKLTTRSYEHIRETCRLVEFDTDQLFEAIQTWNPYAKDVVHTFRTNIDVIYSA